MPITILPKFMTKLERRFRHDKKFLPKIYRVQYEDKDMKTMLDLDSPIQLVNRSSNFLIVMDETPDPDVKVKFQN